MKRRMTQEEYRNHVYSKYNSSFGKLSGSGVDKPLGFVSPDKCYEMINERREIDHRTRYSRHNNYYKISW